MADVEMTDAAPKATKKAVAAGGEADGKKRFEVKKVGYDNAERFLTQY
jgi:RING-box protein 1